MEDEPKDLWDYQDQYNLEPKPPTQKQPESSLSKVPLSKESQERLRKSLDKLTYTKPKPFVPLTVESFKAEHPDRVIVEEKPLSASAEKYRKAWRTVYNRLPEWRRKEIDERMKNGTMKEDKTDFAQQVAALAEKQ